VKHEIKALQVKTDRANIRAGFLEAQTQHSPGGTVFTRQELIDIISRAKADTFTSREKQAVANEWVGLINSDAHVSLEAREEFYKVIEPNEKLPPASDESKPVELPLAFAGVTAKKLADTLRHVPVDGVAKFIEGIVVPERDTDVATTMGNKDTLVELFKYFIQKQQAKGLTDVEEDFMQTSVFAFATYKQMVPEAQFDFEDDAP